MLMYMLLWDRRGLSEKNNWYDKNGRVYVYFTNEQFTEVLKCSKQTVVTTKEELHKFDLLEEVRQGINKPNRLYINGSLKNRLQEVQNLDGINTNIINTNISKITTTNTGEQNPLEKTATDINIYDYYQQRIGSLDGFQYEQLKGYLDIDKLEPELVKKAIDKGADNSKRNFGYINTILKNWAQNGILTVAQQEEEQRRFIDSKTSKQKTNDWEPDPNYPAPY